MLAGLASALSDKADGADAKELEEAKMLVDIVTKSLQGKTSVESLTLRAQCSVTLSVIAKWKVCVYVFMYVCMKRRCL